MVSPHSLVEGLAPSRLPARKRRLAALCNNAVTEKRIFHFDATPLPLPMRRSATVDFYTAGSIFFCLNQIFERYGNAQISIGSAGLPLC
jgi:hypothetical protein